MNSTIRVVTLLALVSAASAAQSGRPPVPPVPPAAPVAPVPHPMPLRMDAMMDRDAMREMTAQARELSRQSLESSRDALEAARIAMQDMRIRDIHIPDIQVPEIHIPDIHIPPMHFDGAYDFGPRYQDDPADSLYRSARDLLNNSDYRAAAQRFKEVQQKYPNSRYMANAMYFQAFALYRVGGDAELRDALAILDQQVKQFPNASMASGNGSGRGRGMNMAGGGAPGRGITINPGDGRVFVNRGENPTDVPALQMRIRGVQAARGDASAKRALDQMASDSTCDRDLLAVQSEALSGLMRIDPSSASGHLDKILARRDRCSVELRRTALQILARTGDDKSMSTLVATAKSDPSSDLRRTAVDYLSRSQSDEAVSTLESLAKSEQNEQVRRSAARGLVGNGSTRARQAARTLVEDNTVPDDIRTEMLSRYGSDRGTTDDATWLRALYPKVTSPSVKNAIVGAVARIGGADSQKWLIDMSTNDQESTQVRAEAFRAVSKTMTVAELSRSYDAAGSRATRSEIVRALNSRKDPEALDKLIDIVKKGTDPTLRSSVIQMLLERKDPKVTALLLDLISR